MFRGLVRGPKRDPSLFTSVLTEGTSSALKTKLDMTSIISYACSDRSSVVRVLIVMWLWMAVGNQGLQTSETRDLTETFEAS